MIKIGHRKEIFAIDADIGRSYAELIIKAAKDDLYQSTATTMKAAILAHAEYQQQSDEVEVFRDLLQSCFASNRAHVACHLTQGPPKVHEHLWGWRANEKDGEVSGKRRFDRLD